jgi:hypothetical protein
MQIQKCRLVGLIASFVISNPLPLHAESVRLNMFAVSQNLAVFVAQDKQLYAKYGLDVSVQFTPNSQAQREGIAKGQFEIAHAGVDNAVAINQTAWACSGLDDREDDSNEDEHDGTQAEGRDYALTPADIALRQKLKQGGK